MPHKSATTYGVPLRTDRPYWRYLTPKFQSLRRTGPREITHFERDSPRLLLRFIECLKFSFLATYISLINSTNATTSSTLEQAPKLILMAPIVFPSIISLVSLHLFPISRNMCLRSSSERPQCFWIPPGLHIPPVRRAKPRRDDFFSKST